MKTRQKKAKCNTLDYITSLETDLCTTETRNSNGVRTPYYNIYLASSYL